MKKTAVLLTFFLISYLGFTQNSPKINFTAQENTIDYGNVVKNKDSGVRSFEFTNTGDAILFITLVQSTSGILILYKPSTGIMPGKKDKIDIKYNMNTGPIRKTITVESNAVNYPDGRVALKIKGEVLD